MQLAEKISPTVPHVSCRSILVVSGTRLALEHELHPHKGLHARRLESALSIIRDEKPDLVVIFLQGRENNLEEHILTWMIEGFRGHVVLMDTTNRLSEASAEILREGQVVDEIHSGPTTPDRFLTILRSHLGQLQRSSSPRSLMTFDLFHSLFERGINAVFFFSYGLERCLSANLAAEQLTGRTLVELRGMGLADLCEPSQVEGTLQTVRRSARHYYDMKGVTAFRSKTGNRIESVFSVSWLSFGRSRFIKLEVQTPPGRRAEDPKLIDRTALLAAVDQSFRESQRSQSGLSLALFRLVGKGEKASGKEWDEALQAMHRMIENGIRKTDRAIRMKRDEIGLLLPKTDAERADLVVERLKSRMEGLPSVKKLGGMIETKILSCPSEAFAFMDFMTLSRG